MRTRLTLLALLLALSTLATGCVVHTSNGDYDCLAVVAGGALRLDCHGPLSR